MIWADYSGGHVGDPTIESRLFSAVTGCEVDEAGLNAMGERIFNLQRALLLRHGWVVATCVVLLLHTTGVLRALAAAPVTTLPHSSGVLHPFL